MIARCAAALAASFFGLTACAFAQAKAPISDALCPSAVPALKTLVDVPATGDPVKIIEASEAVERAYLACASQALTDGAVEPTMHYDQVRAAQYEVLAGRAYLSLKRWDDAHAAFIDARKNSGDVYDWVPPSRGYTTSNAGGTSTSRNMGVTRSQYRDAASDIMKAADAELAKLVPAAKPKS
ncbi:MAG: hypothetical protein ABR591_00955 [Candidatus Velthaea sp.]